MFCLLFRYLSLVCVWKFLVFLIIELKIFKRELRLIVLGFSIFNVYIMFFIVDKYFILGFCFIELYIFGFEGGKL